MESAFESTTRVTPVPHEPGRYSANIDESWNLRPLPQGGIVTALAVRAMTRALDRPEQTLRTLHTAYVAPVTHGDVVVEVSDAPLRPVDVPPAGRGTEPERIPRTPDDRGLRVEAPRLRLRRPRTTPRLHPVVRVPLLSRAAAPGCRVVPADALLGPTGGGTDRHRARALGGVRTGSCRARRLVPPRRHPVARRRDARSPRTDRSRRHDARLGR